MNTHFKTCSPIPWVLMDMKTTIGVSSLYSATRGQAAYLDPSARRTYHRDQFIRLLNAEDSITTDEEQAQWDHFFQNEKASVEQLMDVSYLIRFQIPAINFLCSMRCSWNSGFKTKTTGREQRGNQSLNRERPSTFPSLYPYHVFDGYIAGYILGCLPWDTQRNFLSQAKKSMTEIFRGNGRDSYRIASPSLNAVRTHPLALQCTPDL